MSVMTSSCVGPEAEIALVAVLQAQQLRAELRPSGRIPATARRAGSPGISSSSAPARFISSRTMLLDLAQGAQAQRHPGVEARGEAADEARAQHELVAHDFGLGGSFLERVDRVLGQRIAARECIRCGIRL